VSGGGTNKCGTEGGTCGNTPILVSPTATPRLTNTPVPPTPTTAPHCDSSCGACGWWENGTCTNIYGKKECCHLACVGCNSCIYVSGSDAFNCPGTPSCIGLCTPTPIPPTATPKPPTNTPVPSTATPKPPTSTPVPTCLGTDTSCGTWPNCVDCNANDGWYVVGSHYGCVGSDRCSYIDYEYRDYYCSGTSCTYQVTWLWPGSPYDCSTCPCGCSGGRCQTCLTPTTVTPTPTCAPVCSDPPVLSKPALGTILGVDSVTLTWKAPGSWGKVCPPEVTDNHYVVYVSKTGDSDLTDNSDLVVNQRVEAGTTSYTVTGLNKDITYYWQVRANNGH